MMVNEKENDLLDEIFYSYSLGIRHQLVVMVFDTNLLAIMGYIVNLFLFVVLHLESQMVRLFDVDERMDYLRNEII